MNRRRQFLTDGVMEGLRKVVVNLALPSVVFISFLRGIRTSSQRMRPFSSPFSACALSVRSVSGVGLLLKRLGHVQHGYFPFLMTGFEYGMLGVSLFGSAYGVEKIGYIAVVDLGHEFFIWFVFLGLLLMRRDGLQNPQQWAKVFSDPRVSLAIVAGLLLNVLGGQTALYQWPVTGALMATLQFLGNLAIPLDLLIVGYNLQRRSARN